MCFVEVILFKKTCTIFLDIKYRVRHPFMTEEFYGTTLPDVELKICDLTWSNMPSTVSVFITPQDDDFSNLEFTVFGRNLEWTLRQVEDVTTKEEYSNLLDSCDFLDFQNFLTHLPVTITILIGEFCNPVISRGHITCLSKKKDT